MKKLFYKLCSAGFANLEKKYIMYLGIPGRVFLSFSNWVRNISRARPV